MKLGDIFKKRVVTATMQDSLETVATRMQEHNVGTVVVVDGRRPVGIITDRDLALALGARGVRPQAPAEKVMTGNVRTIPNDTGIFTATQLIRDYEVRRLPIVDREGNLTGVVSVDDILRYLGRELFNLSEGIKHETQAK